MERRRYLRPDGCALIDCITNTKLSPLISTKHLQSSIGLNDECGISRPIPTDCPRPDTVKGSVLAGCRTIAQLTEPFEPTVSTVPSALITAV